MQYQTCECGEQISPNELGTKLLTHWQHQHQTCLYSYIGCVSNSVSGATFEATYKLLISAIKISLVLQLEEHIVVFGVAIFFNNSSKILFIVLKHVYFMSYSSC